MVNRNYRSGANFERRCRKYLEEKDYTVFRSAGSHSASDLICLKYGEVLLVQCQTNPNFAPAKVQQLFEMALQNGTQAKLMWREGKKICIGDVV